MNKFLIFIKKKEKNEKKKKGEEKGRIFFQKRKKRKHQNFLFVKNFFPHPDFGLMKNPLRQNTTSSPSSPKFCVL